MSGPRSRPPRLLRALAIGGLTVLLAAPSAATAAGQEAINQTTVLRSLADGQDVPGSRATLHRTAGGIAVNVTTAALEPHEVVDVLWAVFNDPSACVHGNPLTGAPCGPADLGVEAAQPSLLFATTAHANRSGRLTYRSTLAVGDTSACVGDPFPCNGGLSDPFGAEVHSAIFNGDLGRQAAQFLAGTDTINDPHHSMYRARAIGSSRVAP
jgi:hypothetical protein